MASASVSMEQYLKRYMSSDEINATKKTKKTKKSNDPVKPSAARSKIVDDDINWKDIAVKDEDDLLAEYGDEAPQVAAIIDERPADVVKMEEFKQGNKWRALEADGANSLKARTAVKSRLDSDSDLSPPRASTGGTHKSDTRHVPKGGSNPGLSPPRASSRSTRIPDTRRASRRDSDSDLSPPRVATSNMQRSSKNGSDSDLSPPRAKSKLPGVSNSKRSRPRRDHSGDRSRRRRADAGSSDSGSDQKSGKRQHSNADSDRHSKRSKQNVKDPVGDRRGTRPQAKTRWGSPSSGGEGPHKGGEKSEYRGSSKNNSSLPKKTLDGKKAGLLDAGTLKYENYAAKERENKAFDQLGDDVSGHNAKTILRSHKSKEERDLEAKEDAIKAARAAQYKKWGQGLKQQEMQNERVVEMVHEMSKPLARHDDDADLDQTLRQQERTGDPMLEYMRKKRKAEQKAATGVAVIELPRYKGPAPPPNRFQIFPGYRWDGLDRSNGFEKSRVSRQNNKIAVEEDAYKWSVENM